MTVRTDESAAPTSGDVTTSGAAIIAGFLIFAIAVLGLVRWLGDRDSGEYTASKTRFEESIKQGAMTVGIALDYRKAAAKRKREVGVDSYQWSEYFDAEARAVLEAANLGDVSATLDLWFFNETAVDRTSGRFVPLIANNVEADGAPGQPEAADIRGRAFVAMGEAYYLGLGVVKNDKKALSYFMSALATGKLSDFYLRQTAAYLKALYEDFGCAMQSTVWAPLGGPEMYARGILGRMRPTPPNPPNATQVLWGQEVARQIDQKIASGVTTAEILAVLSQGGPCPLQD